MIRATGGDPFGRGGYANLAAAPARPDSTQLALLDAAGAPVEPMPPAQRHSPTSAAAAESVRPSVSSLRGKVLDYIAAHGPVTDEQVQDGLAMPGSTQRPRRIELLRAGLIVQQGTAPTRSGRSAALWVVAS